MARPELSRPCSRAAVLAWDMRYEVLPGRCTRVPYHAPTSLCCQRADAATPFLFRPVRQNRSGWNGRWETALPPAHRQDRENGCEDKAPAGPDQALLHYGSALNCP